jgi:hypothetical protein
MNRVVEVLCRREGIGIKEAVHRVNNVREMIADSNYSYDEVEDILMSELGLEMDYIFGLI